MKGWCNEGKRKKHEELEMLDRLQQAVEKIEPNVPEGAPLIVQSKTSLLLAKSAVELTYEIK
jgi:hypothetical protein